MCAGLTLVWLILQRLLCYHLCLQNQSLYQHILSNTLLTVYTFIAQSALINAFSVNEVLLHISKAKIHKISITTMCLKITCLKLHPCFLEADELSALYCIESYDFPSAAGETLTNIGKSITQTCCYLIL